MSNLKAIKRDSSSTGATNKLRSSGLIPAILYGGKDPNQKISIVKKDIREIINSDNFWMLKCWTPLKLNDANFGVLNFHF